MISVALSARADGTNATTNATNADQAASTPEHLAQAFIQYGIAFTGEFVVAPGPICNFTGAPQCILGTGGGLTVRGGKRLRGPWYIGGAYEFSKMDSAQLYRVGILQQLRAEGRYYVSTGRSIEPYVMATAGVDVYGNLWGIDTGGPLFGVALGTEFQLSTYIVLGVAVSYRALFMSRFTDSASTERPPGDVGPGFAHLIGIDLIVETRDPL